jgi:hypothetical protein
MAVDYGTLKAEVIDFAGRDDLSSRFDTFLMLGESAIYNNDDKPLRVSPLEISATSQTISGTNSVDLPSGYLNMRSLKLSANGNECEFDYESPSSLQVRGSGQPRKFTISGSKITFDTVPDGAYDLDIGYYARPEALDATNDTNVILTNYPDIYLYACMFSVYDYASEAQLSELHYNKMLRSIRGAMKADSKGLRPNAAMRLRGSTP